MFIEIDVVEFIDKDIPYTTIVLNMNSVASFQPIAKRHREAYTTGRNMAIEKSQTDPNVRVSPIEELPHNGAIMSMAGQAVLYTVTPFNDVKKAVLEAQGNSAAT